MHAQYEDSATDAPSAAFPSNYARTPTARAPGPRKKKEGKKESDRRVRLYGDAPRDLGHRPSPTIDLQFSSRRSHKATRISPSCLQRMLAGPVSCSRSLGAAPRRIRAPAWASCRAGWRDDHRLEPGAGACAPRGPVGPRSLWVSAFHHVLRFASKTSQGPRSRRRGAGAAFAHVRRR